MPTVHPLPVNPTTGQQPLAALRGALGGGTSSSGVNRDILKGLQDVAWSDDEVRPAQPPTPPCGAQCDMGGA
jgi:CCR4-NOT transcription complex subunit 4